MQKKKQAKHTSTMKHTIVNCDILIKFVVAIKIKRII